MMNPQTDNMEHLLAELGRAHQDGALQGNATRYPWLADKVATQSRKPRRSSWIWVGGPVAAAAAVAVLFVVPDLFPTSRPVVPTGHHHIVDAEDGSGCGSLEFDFNGDGVVDGRDIQALTETRHEAIGDPTAEREYKRKAEGLNRCLLGG